MTSHFSECTLWPLKADYKWHVTNIASSQVTGLLDKRDQGLWILSRWLVISKVFLESRPLNLVLHVKCGDTVSNSNHQVEKRHVSTSYSVACGKEPPLADKACGVASPLSSHSLPGSFPLRCFPPHILTIMNCWTGGNLQNHFNHLQPF